MSKKEEEYQPPPKAIFFEGDAAEQDPPSKRDKRASTKMDKKDKRKSRYSNDKRKSIQQKDGIDFAGEELVLGNRSLTQGDQKNDQLHLNLFHYF